MKRLIKISLVVFIALSIYPDEAVYGQAIKTNLPFILAGSPNLGVEYTLSKNLAVSGDIMWLPYLFKKEEEVFRSLQANAELRYYPSPRYYYNNNMYDGFYLGPYVLIGDFNIGFKTDNEDPLNNFRREGWGISSGLSIGYKFFLSRRFKLDCNLGLGYAHIQYDKYYLGGEWANYPLEIKNTKSWVGPTKFGVSLVYTVFK